MKRYVGKPIDDPWTDKVLYWLRRQEVVRWFKWTFFRKCGPPCRYQGQFDADCYCRTRRHAT